MPEKPPPSLPPSLPPQRVRAPAVTLLDDEETINVIPIIAQLRDRAVFTQMNGLEAGRVCDLEGVEITFGRAPTCTHAFDEASLSRVHARLVREGGAYVIEDAGSRNGIFVNDQKVARAVLGDGDRVRLGSGITLRFQLVDPKEEAALVRVYESSVKDGLTGAWNRKYLDERLRSEIAFAQRHKNPLAIVLVDIDHFKKVNDTYGHPAGDEVLKSTAATLQRAIRTEDVLARYGGEEFLVIARGVDLRSAMQLAERLRILVERNAVTIQGKVIARTPRPSSPWPTRGCTRRKRPEGIASSAASDTRASPHAHTQRRCALRWLKRSVHFAPWTAEPDERWGVLPDTVNGQVAQPDEQP
jgi:diguanylate cyclase (GGDEF)-like protein